MNIDTYTTNNAIKNLALLEVHLKEFSQAPIFCAECCGKHLYILEGLSQECIGVCELGESVWYKLADWAVKQREEIPSLTSEFQLLAKKTEGKKAEEIEDEILDKMGSIAGTVEIMANEARIFRKELEMFIITCDSEGCSIPSLGHLENRPKKGHLVG